MLRRLVGAVRAARVLRSVGASRADSARGAARYVLTGNTGRVRIALARITER